MFTPNTTKDQNIIRTATFQPTKHSIHKSLECRWSITHPKWHP